MSLPIEFTPDHIDANSPQEAHLFRGFLRSGEPFKSLIANNPWLQPPDLKQPLGWGEGQYWDTTVARKHNYWKDKNLPIATRDIHQMRRDFNEWGYCLIAEGLSRDQCNLFYQRLLEQAEGERLAGIDQQTPTGQYVNTLINKGRLFAGVLSKIKPLCRRVR